MYPDDGYVGTLGAVDTAREWSLLDVLRVSRNALCGVALGTWATARRAFLAARRLSNTLHSRAESTAPRLPR
jgi:hypothetical protein